MVNDEYLIFPKGVPVILVVVLKFSRLFAINENIQQQSSLYCFIMTTEYLSIHFILPFIA